MNEAIMQIAIYAIPVLLSITVHEFFHGFTAYKLGDPTAKLMGRLTLNPIAHIELFGTVILPLMLIITNSPFLIAWAKPVPINPLNFKNSYRDMAISSIAGPLSNIILSLIFFACYLFISSKSSILGQNNSLLFSQICKAGFSLNFALFAFNILPVPPLDGSKVLMTFLPLKGKLFLEKIEPYGFFIILGLLILRIIDIYMILMRSLFISFLNYFIGGL